MAVERTFLGWERPLLDVVVERLTAGWTAGPLDLRGQLLVMSTRQSGRRLRDRLAELAAARNTGVLVPECITPDRLLRRRENDRLVPSRAEELAIWTAVLNDLAAEDYPALFPGWPAGMERPPGWAIGIARRLSELRRQLAETGLTIGDCLAPGRGVDDEVARWEDLARLEAIYLRRLQAVGRKDVVAAMREAVADPELPPETCQVIVIAVPDPVPLALSALATVARTIPVAVWIHAPEDHAAAFDEWGRPLPEAWERHELTLPSASLRLAGGPGDQAEELVRVLGGDSGSSGGAAPAVAVLREELFPAVAAELRKHGLVTYDPAGVPLAETALGRLVTDCLAVVTDQSFVAVARLFRQPAILDYLVRQIPGADVQRLLTELDTVQNRYLPQTRVELRRAVAKMARSDQDPTPILPAALSLSEQLFANFAEQSFATAIRGVLAALFSGTAPGDSPRACDFRAAAEVLNRLLDEFATPTMVASGLSVGDNAALFVELLARESVYPEHPERALDLQGWLELAWEDAPRLVLVGMNDGAVPEAVVGDVFLPDGRRAALGLPDNRRRFARDAFLFQSMLASRTPGAVTGIVGKTEGEGSPLRPSRLLFLCSDAELSERAVRLFADLPAAPPPPVPATPAWTLLIPRPPPFTRLAVTGFRDYLQCPFRFLLKHGLGMAHLDDRQRELDPAGFGEFCHLVLRDFGLDSEARDATDPDLIREFLWQRLAIRLRERFGADLPLAVFVQAEGLRQRLAQFAQIQAAERAAGWRLIGTEQGFGRDDAFLIGGLPVRGRIDRIEEHEGDGRLRILDYKTGDKAETPGQRHLAKFHPGADPDYTRVVVKGKERRWCDLQLPIYRLMLAATDSERNLVCGYFNLPKAVGDVGICEWHELDTELLAGAARCAEQVAGQIRQGVFWPPATTVPHDDFAELFAGGMALTLAGNEWLEGAP